VRSVLDLVALGSLADVVPLSTQNRILAKNGLLVLAQGHRPGLAALKEAAGFERNAALDAGQVVFGLAPRINASSRMAHGQLALDMLLAKDVETARPLAAKLDKLNQERRSEEARILEQALAQADEQLDKVGLVLFGEDWSPGVIGIVASRVVEAHYRPTVMLCQDQGVVKGSGRSIPECDIHGSLVECADCFQRFGGHRQAAGLTLNPGALASFRTLFNEAVVRQLGPAPIVPRLRVDRTLPFKDIDFTLLKELELLEPHGMGNPRPVFASPPVRVREARFFGRDKAHANLELRDETGGVTLRGKAWRKAKELPADLRDSLLRVAFTPQIDRYNGLAAIDLHIRDWNRES